MEYYGLLCLSFFSFFLFLKIISKVKSCSKSYPLSSRVDLWIAKSSGVWNRHGRGGGVHLQTGAFV